MLEEILSIGTEDDNLIFQWVGITTDVEGNIYITDLKDYSIKKFNEKGEFIKKSGRRGQGPGEFQSPGILRYYKGYLFVAEIQHRGIQVFDTNLNFKFKIPIDIPVSDFELIDKDKIAITTINENCILIYDYKGKRKEKIKYAEDKRMMLNTVTFKINNDNYFLAFQWKDIIVRLNKNGQKIWTKNLLNIKKIKIKKTGFFNIPVNIVYKTIEIDSKGNIFILGGHLSKHKSRDVYVLSKSGKYLTTIILPEPTHTIYIDNKNYLYSRSAMGICIKKYKLRYMENN
ncbi:6-bladed beta-propeller [Candidatus Aminicenantes bacterium AH-873-B07]|nr:6-bladed beta-propeller [Candidatus Aminicenantes bacterium AH-873-B07]